MTRRRRGNAGRGARQGISFPAAPLRRRKAGAKRLTPHAPSVSSVPPAGRFPCPPCFILFVRRRRTPLYRFLPFSQSPRAMAQRETGKRNQGATSKAKSKESFWLNRFHLRRIFLQKEGFIFANLSRLSIKNSECLPTLSTLRPPLFILILCIVQHGIWWNAEFIPAEFWIEANPFSSVRKFQPSRSIIVLCHQDKFFSLIKDRLEHIPLRQVFCNFPALLSSIRKCFPF